MYVQGTPWCLWTKPAKPLTAHGHISCGVSAGPSESVKKLKFQGQSCESCQLTGHSRRISGFVLLRRKSVAQHMMRVSISKTFLEDPNKITLLQPQSLFMCGDIWKATCGLTKHLRRKQNKCLEITCAVCLLSLNQELILFPWLLYPSLQLWHSCGIRVTISKRSQLYKIEERVCTCFFSSLIYHP